MLRLRPFAALLLSAVTLAAPALPAQYPAGQLYRDPSGRFTVTVPGGWQLTSQNGGAILTRGNAMAMVTPFQGASSGREVVNLLANQYAKQWRNLNPVNQGDFQLAGQPGAYATFSGTSPKGVNSVLRLSGIASRGDGYAFVISAPNNEFNQASPDFQAIEGSFTIGGGNGGDNPGGNPGGNYNPGPGGNNGAPPAVALGVQSRDLEPNDLQQLGLRDGRGTLIAAVQPGSAAAQAGVQPGDVVVSVDGSPVERTTDLRARIATHRPGDRITLGVIRGGQSGSIQVVLAGPGGGNAGGNLPGGDIPGGNAGGNNPGGNGFGGQPQNGGDPNVQQQAPDSTAAVQQQGGSKLMELVYSPGALLVALVLVGLVVWRLFKKP